MYNHPYLLERFQAERGRDRLLAAERSRFARVARSAASTESPRGGWLPHLLLSSILRRNGRRRPAIT